MSYSTNPELDADRYLDKRFEAEHDRELATWRAANDFERDWLTKPIKSPTTCDESRNEYTWPGGKLVKTPRPATVGEVIYDALDHTHGPSFDDVLALIQRAARGESIENDALQLIKNAAQTYAYYKVDV